MHIKVKRLHELAKLPTYAYDSDAGADLVAAWLKPDFHRGYTIYGTGLAFEIPKGYVGLIYMRSSVSEKNQVLANAVGVIDAGYRGEVTVRMKPTASGAGRYEVGDRIAQLIIQPVEQHSFEEVSELEQTDRGTGGYGSSESKSNA